MSHPTLVLAAWVLLSVVPSTGQAPSSVDADRMQAKLLAIAERSTVETATAPLRTSFSEREVNAYFRVHGPGFLPEGVTDPQVTIDEGGHLQARAIVDLDVALKPQARNWFDPLAWLGGKVEVTAAGTLQASAGRGAFALERTTLAGVAVPVTVLQELVSFYSRSPDNPSGFRLDQPFDLPARIRNVETRRGGATVVQ